MTKKLGARKAREIRDSINRQIDLWERGIYAGLLGDMFAEGRAREGRVARSYEEEEDHLVHSFHRTFLLRKLQQEVHQATHRGRGSSWGMSA